MDGNFKTWKIYFSNREQFEKAHGVIFHINTRLNSAGMLDVGYLDMIFCFSDQNHWARAVDRVKNAEITDFEVKTPE